MITLVGAGRARKPRPARARQDRHKLRRWHGALAAVSAPAAVATVLDQLSSRLNLTSTSLLFLAAVVAVARLGGMLSALGAGLWASLLLNYFFVPPLHSATIANANDAIALAVFVVVALTVASVVDLAARQSRRAARANAQAETLNALSLAVLRGDEALGALLDQLRAAFHAGSASLLQRYEAVPREASADGGWRTIAASGDHPAGNPVQADTAVTIDPDVVLALRGRVLAPADRRVLSAFAAQANAALERRRLAESAAKSAALEAADKMRTALLAAVSHDLRSPLSAARTAVDTLADPDLILEPDDNLELLEIADESLARLSRLLEDLLDMSRLQAGVLKPRLVPLDAHDVLSPALESLPYGQDRSRVCIAPPRARHAPGTRRRTAARTSGRQPRVQRDQVHRCGRERRGPTVRAERADPSGRSRPRHRSRREGRDLQALPSSDRRKGRGSRHRPRARLGQGPGRVHGRVPDTRRHAGGRPDDAAHPPRSPHREPIMRFSATRTQHPRRASTSASGPKRGRRVGLLWRSSRCGAAGLAGKGKR